MHPPRRPLASCLAAVLGLVLLSAPAPAASWEPVAPTELGASRSLIDPGAGYEAIFVKTWVEDGISGDQLKQTLDRYVRFKVFTDEGVQALSKIDVDFPLRDVFLRDLEARTIGPDGRTVSMDRKAIAPETRVRKQGEGWRRVSFVPPALKPGCVVEYRYRMVGYDQYTGQYDLQFEFPARTISYFMKPILVEGFYLRQMRFHTTAVPSSYPQDGYYETTIRDVPAYKPEPHDPPEYQQRGWMLQYYTREALKEPEKFWSKFGRAQSEWFDDYTKPSREAQDLAREIAQGAANDEERVRRLAEWVQRDFRVCRSDEPESLRAAGLHMNGSLREALKQRGGTIQDGDLVFAGLARVLGLDVRYLRVPSRRLWFFDRYMMDGWFIRSYEIAIRLNGAWRSFDPATRYLPWDMVPWDEEMQPALLCDRDSSRFVDTYVAPPERSCVARVGTLKLAEDGAVEGDLDMAFCGHLNESMRTAFEGVAGDDLDSTLVHEAEWAATGMRITQVELVRGGDERQPFRLKCHVRLPDFAAVTGKRIVLEPALYHARTATPFTASLRRYPVCFDHAWSERDSLTFELPAGWKAQAVEGGKPVDAPGVAGYWSQVLVSDDGRRILFLRSLHVGDGGSLFFPRESYPQVKQLYDQILERDRTAMTLVRAEDAR